ncbi:phosphate ABC transporter permease subunit PstC [Maritimibacter sp. DP1N21-5]|uniref:phosphate ABC transporter permease subunit PstC n=1 Tax=Maritimibacter sp. DP1N21-5 TaxID=2836867 RepID=UPI001C48F69C|nr:phosphate ABC transporter permease subunit PstC [Maritimibacter sp. DP1N21-5]MBV7409833.1 phosphate ABC transporter permease subunit PstC [Maritimibacter sp. DP1N21-5]
MSPLILLAIVIALSVAGYVLGRARAVASVDDVRKLHSLPNFYGMNVAMLAFVPAVLLLAVWVVAQPMVISGQVRGMVPETMYDDTGALSLIMSDVSRVAEGLSLAVQQGVVSAEEAASLDAGTTNVREMLAGVGVAIGSDVAPEVLEAAQSYRAMNSTGHWIMTVLVLIVAVAGFLYAYRSTTGEMRARNRVEQGILILLISAALIAILTTVGIVLSLLFNTIKFFQLYPADEFFFGTTWAPSFGGGSELGILPLLWGTLYISLIALAVAVPIGLFAAIYLSEYAGPKLRSVAKPLLEVLAGIPTIVYGLFALLTVGPLLLEVFGAGGILSLGWMQGGTAVMTAGLVMGIMLIPFVSSLSDDIINAVPQAMRDGSYGLGATQSETIRKVVLPAALPGIVGAILLAASRAIGETMIVVLGAGAAARLSLNPFDAMTTVTAKIVSQLTGDADFASPEALVAFSLGMTLFVVTLCLNILALYIVRKYREQYE